VKIRRFRRKPLEETRNSLVGSKVCERQLLELLVGESSVKRSMANWMNGDLFAASSALRHWMMIFNSPAE
jgi:hypothetical protein